LPGRHFDAASLGMSFKSKRRAADTSSEEEPMYLRPDDDGHSQSDGLSASRHASASGLRSDRVREIRQRIADNAYRSVDVADEIARRILRSSDL
jgi:anti-sigma28 factor (negative regulator of flagellin synthesis)